MPIRQPLSFEDDENFSHEAIQAEYSDAEQWEFHAKRLRPDGDVNRATIKDAKRPDFVAPAIFNDEHKQAQLALNEMVFTSTDPEIHVRICDLVWRPGKGDVVLRRKTGKTYEIKEVGKDSMSGRCLRLSQQGRPEP